MYRSRLDGDLDRITLGYVSSVSDDQEIAEYDILGSQAHTVMLYGCGLITAADSRKILAALEGMRGADLAGDGPEDIHELIEARVIKEAGRASGGRMHTGRSRNDQVALDIRMKMRDDICALCGLLLDAIDALVSLAERHQRTLMPLYTHLQQAQAGTFSHYLLAHADALFRDLGRLSDSFERVNQSPLGAGPVGGTSLPIDRDMTARLLGFSGLVENSIDATSTRDHMAEFVAHLAILMTNLSRMAEDFVIWSSTEFSFIELSDELASPSSVMPQKKNPDILELMRAKTSMMIGSLAGILATMKGLATGYGRDLQETKSPVWAGTRTCAASLAVMRSVLMTLTVNEKAMRRAANGGYLTALDVAERLVIQGMPFRTAHRISGRLVQLAHASGKPLNRLTAREMRGIRDADPRELAGIIKGATAAGSLRERVSRGSAGFSEQKRMIGQRRVQIRDCREELAHREGIIASSLEALHAKVAELARPRRK